MDLFAYGTHDRKVGHLEREREWIFVDRAVRNQGFVEGEREKLWIVEIILYPRSIVIYHYFRIDSI